MSTAPSKAARVPVENVTRAVLPGRHYSRDYEREKLSNVADRPRELGGVLLRLSGNARRLLLHAIDEAHASAHEGSNSELFALRQRSSAMASSLNAISSAFVREPAPFVPRMRATEAAFVARVNVPEVLVNCRF
jgi:hypothetical protein